MTNPALPLPVARPEPLATTATATAARAHALSHVAPLDGLRGIAVLLVLLFHFSWTFPESTAATEGAKRVFWSGWIGVDLFFVLSGYLITRGLVAPSERPVGERLRLFWMRRVLRIFPLYYIFLVAGTVVCLAVGATPPSVGYWLYAQNYTLAWDPEPLRWTAHLWSLAIEEQFYFLWPLFALLAPKRHRVTFALLLLAAGAALRTVLVLKVGATHPEFGEKFAYRATPSHMDGLLLGAIIAMMAADPEHFTARAWQRLRTPLLYASGIGLAGLAVLARGFGTYDRRVMIIGYPLLALFFATTISFAVDGRLPPRLARVLSSGALPSCGRVSYAMYIFHWPIIALAAPSLERLTSRLSVAAGAALNLAVVVVGTLVTYGLAVVSYKYVESPFLKLKERFHG